MTGFVHQILTFLSESPGSLVFHLALILSIAAALQAVVIIRRTSANRIFLGLAVLIFGQLVLFLASCLVWLGAVSSHYLLPPLDRALQTLTIVWFVWMWIAPKGSRWKDLLLALANLLLVILLVVNLVLWASYPPNAAYTASDLDWIWALYGAVFAVGGLVLLLKEHPAFWEFGIGQIGLLLTGLTLQLVFLPAEGDYGGLTRLFFLAAYPFLPILSQRLLLPIRRLKLKSNQPGTIASATSSVLSQPGKIYPDAHLVYSLLQLAKTNEEEQTYSNLCRAVSLIMQADSCLLTVSKEMTEHLVIRSGFDFYHSEKLAGSVISRAQIAGLARCLDKGETVAFGMDSPFASDLSVLIETLKLPSANQALLVPLSQGNQLIAGLVLLTDDPGRFFSENDQAYLSTYYDDFVNIIQKSNQPAVPPQDVDSTSRELQEIRQRLESMQQENQDLQTDLAVAKQVIEKSDATRQVAQVQQEMNERYQRDLSQWQEEIQQANNRADQYQQQLEQNPSAERVFLNKVYSTTQGIRPPAASILGYTDLLLGESIGILGALQRKFLQRIRVSTEKINLTLDELTRNSTNQLLLGEDQTFPDTSQEIITTVIKEIISSESEGRVSTNVKIEDGLPAFKSDRDAVTQILTNLLQNAISASSEGGQILIEAKKDIEETGGYVLIQVTDFGDEITAEELPHLLTIRNPQETNADVFPGRSRTALSIARAITESQGGRIWVESEPQQTCVSVLLPAVLVEENNLPSV